MHDPSFNELIEEGELGDGEVTLRLTLRELAALQAVVAGGARMGIIEGLTLRFAQSGGERHGRRFVLSLKKAEARVGIALARAIGYDGETLDRLYGVQATLDQAEAEL